MVKGAVRVLHNLFRFSSFFSPFSPIFFSPGKLDNHIVGFHIFAPASLVIFCPYLNWNTCTINIRFKITNSPSEKFVPFKSYNVVQFDKISILRRVITNWRVDVSSCWIISTPTVRRVEQSGHNLTTWFSNLSVGLPAWFVRVRRRSVEWETWLILGSGQHSQYVDVFEGGAGGVRDRRKFGWYDCSIGSCGDRCGENFITVWCPLILCGNW